MNYRTLWTLILVWGLATPAFAQLPAARFSAIFPPGGSPRSTVDVTVTGQDLDDTRELRFSHPGITAKKADGDSGKFAVTIAKDVPEGSYDCRLISRFGVSNPRTFLVIEELAKEKPGATAQTATELAFQSVFARAEPAKVDFWACRVVTGQRVIIECSTKDLDSKMVPDLIVSDSAGRELARSRRSGLADVTIPADGVYTIQVSDSQFRGGPEFAYRLSVSVLPHLDAIFPSAGRPGSKSRYTVLGRNLPGGSPSGLVAADGAPLDSLSVEIELPKEVPVSQQLDSVGLVNFAGADLPGFAYRVWTGWGSSNPLPILLVDDDLAVEAESSQPATMRNDRPADAQRIALPATVSGSFASRADKDWYAFEARKGDSYVIDVVSARLNRSSAVSMLLQKVVKTEAGEEKVTDVLESPDDEPTAVGPFRTVSRDPTMKWEVKEDGLYRLRLRDQLATVTNDSTRTYVLSIRKSAPDFAVFAAPLSAAASDSAVWSPTLRKGGTAALRVSIFRHDGYTGDVVVDAKGLPTGVSCKPITLSGNDSSGVLVLSASDDVASWAGPIEVVARGQLGDIEVTRDARYGTVIWGTVGDGKNNDQKNTDVVSTRFSRQLYLGVINEEADQVSIASAEDKVFEVVSGSKASIPLKVKLAGELKQPLKLKVLGIDGYRGGKDLTIEGNADKATLDLDLSQNKLAPGTYTFCVAGPATVRYLRPGEPDTSADKKGEKPKKGKKDPKDTTFTVYSSPITIKVLPGANPKKK